MFFGWFVTSKSYEINVHKILGSGKPVSLSFISFIDGLDCALARRTEMRPPGGWKRPRGRRRQVWVQQTDDSVCAIRRALHHVTGRGHATRSALRASDVHVF